jgi:hypothetical protein
MLEQIQFQVQGSASDPYTVTITLSPLTASCTCPAGQFAAVCKHRTQILSGKDPGVVEGDMSLLSVIAETAAASEFPAALKEYEKAKSKLSTVEKTLEMVFKDWRNTRYRFALGELKTETTVKAAFKDLTDTLNKAVEIKLEAEKATGKISVFLVKSGY